MSNNRYKILVVEDDDNIRSLINAWYAVHQVLENLALFSNDQTDDTEAIRHELVLNAPLCIMSTYDKLSLFLQNDGGFSYSPANNSYSTNGVPNVSDAISTAMALGFNRYIFEIFGLTPIKPFRGELITKYFDILDKKTRY